MLPFGWYKAIPNSLLVLIVKKWNDMAVPLTLHRGLSYTTFKLSSTKSESGASDFAHAKFDVADRDWSRACGDNFIQCPAHSQKKNHCLCTHLLNRHLYCSNAVRCWSNWAGEYAVTVKNTGTVAGDEVVQAYFHPPNNVPSSGGLPLLKQLYLLLLISLNQSLNRVL